MKCLGGKFISELPHQNKNGKIDCKAMVGRDIDILWKNVQYKVKILEYISSPAPKFKTLCNGIEYTVQCGSFIRGGFSGVVGYEQPSKNKFEYSEEHNCWFGWTQKGEKFAFDGDDETIEFIKKYTWSVSNNKINCTKLRKSLRQVVLGVENTRKESITHISNELGLLDKFFDNRKCNLKIKLWGNSDRKNVSNKNNHYEYKMTESSDGKFLIVEDSQGECFIIDNSEEIIDVIRRIKCKVDIRNSTKKYIRCGKTDLHREILGITDSKYSEWFVDHINGDGTDNRLENLVITDHYGNMCNQKGKGYRETDCGTFRVQYMKEYNDERMFNGKPKSPIFKTEKEAINEVNRRKEYILKNRLHFNNKEELDKYIESQSIFHWEVL